MHQKLIKSKPKTEESIAKRVKSKNEKIAEIKEEEKNVNNLLFNYYFTNYQSPSNMYKKNVRQTVKEIKIKYIQLKKY